jgi:hypothetical protein
MGRHDESVRTDEWATCRDTVPVDGSSMMSLACSRVFYTAHCCGRMARRTAVLAFIACMVLPHCSAVKSRQNHVTDVYLSRDAHILQALMRHTLGTNWIDGYRMTVTQQTQICWHDSALQFRPSLSRAGQPFSRVSINSPCETTPPAIAGTNVWLQYRGVQEIPYGQEFEFEVVATRIDVWKSDTRGNPPSSQSADPRPAWKTLCASPSPHELHYPNEDPIDVECDGKANSYVENIFSGLLKPSAITPDAPIAKEETPGFYIVKPFPVMRNYDFEAIDGSPAICGLQGTLCTYQHPHADSLVHEIVYAPDGTVLIPATALAYLKNEAELAALLSYSLVAADQHLIGRLFRVQHYMGGRWSFSGRRNGFWIYQFVWNLNHQVMRLGLQQMYLAGYDIRYAPLAWAVEQGKHIKGSLMVPDYRRLPWYAAYGFNDISQLYGDVDYNKLKRGEKEYTQFLEELRQSDPQAFAEKK